MIRKTALLSGFAGALLMAAPAFAQDAPMPDQPPAPEAAQPKPESLTLQPGSVVRSADGVELGTLVGVRNGAAGQELTVRGPDGHVRPVSLAGIRQQGAEIVVDATAADMAAATALPSEEPVTQPMDEKPDAENPDSEPDA